jgi:nitroreductase
MEYYELIHSRESIRDYDPRKPVPKAVLERVLDAGRIAPSAKNIQPWNFLVLQSPDMLAEVRLCYHCEWFKNAPVILVIAGNKDRAWVRSYDGYNSIETDLAIALTHMILAAENEGLATCFVEAYDPHILRNALDLEENQVVFAITPLGYPHDGFRKKANKVRRSLDEIVRYL